ncbi:60S ribosomal protein P2-alpha [Fusarium falciforme]|nr:60S ribosomal protein P2-alpha [Fusarium falciforme]
MKYLAAYLLLNAAGNTPDATKIKAILESVGIEIEDEKVSSVLSALEGNEKLAAVPAAGPASAGGAAAASGDAAAEEEKEEEAAEESDDDMGFGLFD